MGKSIYRVLVVSPDGEAAAVIQEALEQAAHITERADNGRDGLFMAATERFDVMVCERSLPDGLDGLKLVQTLRSQRNSIAVIVLSDKATVAERIEGLQAGSDDYQGKPLDMLELIARVEALGRRDTLGHAVTKLAVEDLELHLLTQEVYRAGRQIDLLPREYSILRCLVENRGRVVTRNMLLETVWNYNRHTQTNMIEMHMCCLRQKVDKPFAYPLIKTVRGAGYTIEPSRGSLPH
jgi:two-component system OmpR family response regulator